MVDELDLTTGRSRSYALLEGEPATKARKLIADIKTLLYDGLQPPDIKYTLHAENHDQWAIPMWSVRLHFSHSTDTLKTIIDGVAIHFNAIIERERGGVFTLAIPK